MDTVLQTKLHIPQPSTVSTSRKFIIRPRLLATLDESLQRHFTLVVAPTGFGKTTLVATWLAQLTAVHPLWLSLDQHDNDPMRFLTYFIYALRGANDSIGSATLLALQSAQTPNYTELLTAVLNDTAQLDTHLVLVLDDYHLITNPAIHEMMQFVLQNSPPALHLVITSRTDPPWPWARWRARGEMILLQDEALRFTLAETAEFLHDVMGITLSTSEIEILDQQLEGWIVGWQMAALAMQGQRTREGGQGVAHFLHTFSAENRFILDYLLEEVWQQQSDAVQSFLMRSAVLERLNSALCDAVLAREDSQTILTQLERSHLFLIPLDDTRRWYRYHHLFGELLLNRLRQTEPKAIRPLQIKASQWYEAQGLVDEAVSYALAAADLERVANIIAQNALALAYHGDLKTLLHWLTLLPKEMMRKRPFLQIAQAWALAFSGQIEAAEAQLQQVEPLLANNNPVNQAHLTGTMALIRAYCVAIKVEPTETIRLADIALQQLPPDDWLARGMATLLSAIGLRTLGDLHASATLFAKVVTISQVANDPHFMIDVLWERAVLEFQQGQLQQVMHSCQTALQLAHEYNQQSGRQLPVQGYIFERMSAVLLEWNDKTAALHYAQEGYELSQQWGQADAIITNSLRLAITLLTLGDLKQALALVEQAHELATGLSAWYLFMTGSLRAEIKLAQGEVETAVAWLTKTKLHQDGIPDRASIHVYLRIIHILLAKNRLDEANELLQKLLIKAEGSDATHTIIQLLAVQALLLQKQRQSEQAVATLARALTLAEPQGYMRTFINGGDEMGQLLRQTATVGHSITYINKLLQALAKENSTMRSASHETITISFSEREMEVLRLLATPLSSVEIAHELVIAPSTVRSHIKNIYRKLDVHKRITAVQRAQALHLI